MLNEVLWSKQSGAGHRYIVTFPHVPVTIASSRNLVRDHEEIVLFRLRPANVPTPGHFLPGRERSKFRSSTGSRNKIRNSRRTGHQPQKRKVLRFGCGNSESPAPKRLVTWSMVPFTYIHIHRHTGTYMKIYYVPVVTASLRNLARDNEEIVLFRLRPAKVPTPGPFLPGRERPKFRSSTGSRNKIRNSRRAGHQSQKRKAHM